MTTLTSRNYIPLHRSLFHGVQSSMNGVPCVADNDAIKHDRRTSASISNATEESMSRCPRTRRVSLFPRAAMAFFAASLFICASVCTSATVPTPVVSGPIPSTDAPGSSGHNYTFLTTELNFKDRSYVEEEFFI